MSSILGKHEDIDTDRYFLTLTCLAASFFLLILCGIHLIINLAKAPVYLAFFSSIVLFGHYLWFRFFKILFIPKSFITFFGIIFLDLTWYFKFLSFGPVLYFIFAFGALITWIWTGRIQIVMFVVFFVNIAILFTIEYMTPDFSNMYPDIKIRTFDIYLSFILYSLLLIFILSGIKRAFLKQRSKIQYSREKFSTLFLMTPCACSVGEVSTGKYTEINDRFLSMLGYDKEEVIGKTLSELGILSADTQNKLILNDNLHKTKSDIETIALTKSGNTINIILSMDIIELNGNKYWFTIFHDITNLKEAEKERLKSEERFHKLFHNFPIGIYRTTPDGRILETNPALNRMLGFAESEECSNWNLEEASYTSYPRSEFKERLENDGFISGLEGEWQKNDNTKCYVREYAWLVRDDADKILCYEGIIEDITVSKLAEVELTKLNERLEERVMERTAELEALNKALAFHINEIEQFTYIASHDLREPIRTISTFAHLLQEEYASNLDDTANKVIEFISDSANRMSSLVTALLNYSLLGKANVHCMVDCNKIIDEVLDDLSDLILESNANLEVQRLPVVLGMETELRQLFQNLINNAIKFKKSDIQPEIQISAQSLDKEWKFKIVDNGIGIEEKNNEKIFVIFKRLHKRDEYDGTGVGLANCKKIVEMHNGRIWVESTIGVGSAFFFTIPK